jgi:GGDEF domain-containing protein
MAEPIDAALPGLPRAARGPSTWRAAGRRALLDLDSTPASWLIDDGTDRERMLDWVEADTVGGGLRVTMSFGVSASAPQEAFDYKTVCAEADAALYEAKRKGRNAVCGAPAPARQPALS